MEFVLGPLLIQLMRSYGTGVVSQCPRSSVLENIRANDPTHAGHSGESRDPSMVALYFALAAPGLCSFRPCDAVTHSVCWNLCSDKRGDLTVPGHFVHKAVEFLRQGTEANSLGTL